MGFFFALQEEEEALDSSGVSSSLILIKLMGQGDWSKNKVLFFAVDEPAVLLTTAS